ncbi:unnamed protein product [Heligmosomoides polygyrus]|uniref:RNase_Zc3h12a domain-containing protein n=1 Tax=Heligmosomoides polygyrus TaxID=6339 RepID=A0A183GHA7_HELPZ|nr:unnamed protein product [Heligmosomoides polygyrus]
MSRAVNCAGLMAVIRWLLVRDFDVVAFLPVVYNNSHNFNAVHVHLLTKLEELGLVTFTPARTGRGERKAFINYDDLYVTTLAARHGGCVLSGDKFKDILAQSTYSEFHPVIINRTLDVKFRFLPHEVVHHGVDVFYRALPELFIYEDVEIRASVIAQKIFASPDDPEYSKVGAGVPFEFLPCNSSARVRCYCVVNHGTRRGRRNGSASSTT